MDFNWDNACESLPAKEWKCGYCGDLVASITGYHREEYGDHRFIYICPKCKMPTFFSSVIANFNGSQVEKVTQIPGSAYGNNIEFLPEDVSTLYKEIRECIKCRAYTSAVLSMRKLLMHIAVEHGAKENLRFVQYVDYLDKENWIPPNGKGWVDSIRKKGNEATHEIALMSESSAKQLLDFVEMLLVFMYEFPGKYNESKND